LFEQLICRQWGNLNEIASQTRDAGHRKSNSRIEVAPKCRPAHPKERGVVLGNRNRPTRTKPLRRPVTPISRPMLEAMRGRPLRAIAEELTDRGIKTPRGGDVWNQVTVMRSMRRLGITGK
jgi:hypothetical protein